jgi:hypothetical protein
VLAWNKSWVVQGDNELHVSPEDWDPCFLRRKFWTWYLTSAIPDAFTAALDQSTSEALRRGSEVAGPTVLNFAGRGGAAGMRVDGATREDAGTGRAADLQGQPVRRARHCRSRLPRPVPPGRRLRLGLTKSAPTTSENARKIIKCGWRLDRLVIPQTTGGSGRNLGKRGST